jgi:hypothetical protein
LNSVKPNSRIDVRDRVFAKVRPLLEWLSRIHAPAELGLGSVLLDVAHFYDWPDVCRRVAEEGWPSDWQYEIASEEFHRISEVVILCKYCHALFDEMLIPKEIVQAAREQMWTMPVTKPGLRRFIDNSLSHHSTHRPLPFNVSQAALWLYELHGVHEPFIVQVEPRRRGMSYIVDPKTGRVASRFAGDKPKGRP